MCLRQCVDHGLGGFCGGRSVRRKIQIQKQNAHGQIVQVWARLSVRWISNGDKAGNPAIRVPKNERCPARYWRVIRKSPRTKASIWVRKKQSMASSGRQTMGSLSLKEVLSTTGTPVRFSKALISCQ